MQDIRKILIVLLAILASFLALSAIPGGVMLLAGIYSPPVEQLAGSIFESFTIPGLALLLLVGGTSAVAAVALFRKHRHAVLLAAAAGLAVVVFEFVEVLVIGSPPGPARVMQIVYFSIGTCLIGGSIGVLFIDSAGAGPRT